MIPCLGQGHQKEPPLVFLTPPYSEWLLSVYRGVLVTTLAVFCLHLCISDKTYHDLRWLVCTLPVLCNPCTILWDRICLRETNLLAKGHQAIGGEMRLEPRLALEGESAE